MNDFDLMYGTAWKEDETARLTLLAIEAGFRAIDTANQRKHYFEAGVGEAIAEAVAAGLVTRDELFLQTKFTYQRGQDHRLPYDPDASFTNQVQQSFASSLEHLGVDRIDSLVLHGPELGEGITDADREVWRAMEALLDTEQLGAIGVSNISASQLQSLLEWAEHPPSYVQNRCFARMGWDRRVRDVCDANGVGYQGFSLLTANVRELSAPFVRQMADRHDCTIPQLVFRFGLSVGMIPLTGTTDEAHMRQDLAAHQVALEADEIERLELVASVS